MIAGVFSILNSPIFATPTLQFEGDSVHSADEGHVLIRWTELRHDTIYELQQSSDRNFENPRVRYLGPDTAFFASGLTEGSHFFRIREQSKTWAPRLEVQVNYPESSQVWLLLGIGSCVFCALLGFIIYQHRRHYTSGGTQS
ncbi:MAG: hypothetical protein AAF558_05755 [Verrucomicrobiota bacterium]